MGDEPSTHTMTENVGYFRCTAAAIQKPRKVALLQPRLLVRLHDLPLGNRAPASRRAVSNTNTHWLGASHLVVKSRGVLLVGHLHREGPLVPSPRTPPSRTRRTTRALDLAALLHAAHTLRHVVLQHPLDDLPRLGRLYTLDREFGGSVVGRRCDRTSCGPRSPCRTGQAVSIS